MYLRLNKIIHTLSGLLAAWLLLATLAGCAADPEQHQSVFFTRLLEHSSNNNQYHVLFEEGDDRDLRIQIQKLQNDGFSIVTGPSTPPSGGLVCDKYFAAISTSEGPNMFTIRLQRGGFASEWYRIDISISSDCLLTDVAGMKMPQAL